jgi:sulfur relay (sulfurtransferase) DsrC/TusE family protein
MSVEWTPQLAEEIAVHEGIALGEKHWCVIAGSRELVARNGRVPSLAEVGATCGVMVAEINDLFPGGAEEVLARIAGAPEI